MSGLKQCFVGELVRFVSPHRPPFIVGTQERPILSLPRLSHLSPPSLLRFFAPPTRYHHPPCRPTANRPLRRRPSPLNSTPPFVRCSAPRAAFPPALPNQRKGNRTSRPQEPLVVSGGCLLVHVQGGMYMHLIADRVGHGH